MTAPHKSECPAATGQNAEQSTNSAIVAPATQYCNQGVMETLRGHSAALEAIQDARSGTASPDLLHARVQAVILSDSPERLRGFLRTIQKAVEADCVKGLQQ